MKDSRRKRNDGLKNELLPTTDRRLYNLLRVVKAKCLVWYEGEKYAGRVQGARALCSSYKTFTNCAAVSSDMEMNVRSGLGKKTPLWKLDSSPVIATQYAVVGKPIQRFGSGA
jgi:hypothetical protein